MNVLSLCHSSAPSPFGETWSSTTSSGSLPYLGANGGMLTGPIWRANASCCSGVMSWPRKNTTPCASSASSIASTSSCESRRRRSTPGDLRAHGRRQRPDRERAHATSSSCGDPQLERAEQPLELAIGVAERAERREQLATRREERREHALLECDSRAREAHAAAAAVVRIGRAAHEPARLEPRHHLRDPARRAAQIAREAARRELVGPARAAQQREHAVVGRRELERREHLVLERLEQHAEPREPHERRQRRDVAPGVLPAPRAREIVDPAMGRSRRALYARR